MTVAWPHKLRVFSTVTGQSGGTQDDSGVWTDNPATDDSRDLYNGAADVQDGGAMFSPNAQGSWVENSDAVAFVRDTHKIPAMIDQLNLRAEITWEDRTKSMADVIKVRRLDGTIWLKRITT